MAASDLERARPSKFKPGAHPDMLTDVDHPH
jgi:hypothetical protein